MVDELKIETVYIPHLRDQFNAGAVVLFTGAGFSLDGKNINKTNIPSANKLTKLLWDLSYPNDPFEDDTQLQDIFENTLNLHKKELEEILYKLFSVNAKECASWYHDLLSMPWLRSYTLNIDDLVEKILDYIHSTRTAKTISGTTGTISDLTNNRLDVIHLNGSLNDIPNDIVFSRSQYAKHSDNDIFYKQLVADLITRPIVFIGSSLEEGALWEHLSLRGVKGERDASELRPRSYLVIPKLNKSRLSMLAKFNIIWLPMTGEEFVKKILSKLQDTKKSGFESLIDRGLTINRNEHFDLVSDLAQKSPKYTEYLMGQEPVWSDVINERVAERDCFTDLWDEINILRSKAEKKSFIIITGTAGSGKSSALMWSAMKLMSDGVAVYWFDANKKFSRRDFLISLNKANSLGALCINNADIYGNQLSSFIRLALDKYPKMLIVIETRSSKIDRVVNKHELYDIHPNEITIPTLCNNDIDKLIQVLEKENRLGKLKGLDKEERIIAFKNKAGRQLLVAMYEATSGENFSEKATSELEELTPVSKAIYSLVSTASAYRYCLSRDEILIACGNASNETLNSLDALIRRKLIYSTTSKNDFVKSRHRIIANMVYDELIKTGQFEQTLRGLVMIGISKASANSDRSSRPSRMLREFTNHNFMKRAVEDEIARNIYGEFESALAWDAHYWLHRGALELETNQLDLAQIFLSTAMSLNENDPYIQNEWAYLLFKKAISNPLSNESIEQVDEAIKLLEAIIVRREGLSAHAYHVLCQQGLNWVGVARYDNDKKIVFLSFLKNKISEAIKLHPKDSHIIDLEKRIIRESLSIAVS